ncbi:MAG: hypothetical protein ACLFQE_00875 [Thermotogota bacterium]
MKRLLILFFLCGLALSPGFSIEINFERTVPLYLRNFIEPQIERISLELSDLWNVELEYPLLIEIERKRQLGASGEASFDGTQFRLFMTPVTDAISSLLRHEMMHVYSFQWFYDHAITDVPLWFMEGVAVWYENHKGVNIRDVNPVSLIKEIDVLNVEKYPSGDAFARYYSFLADFFYFLDGELNIKDSFDGILQRVKSTGDFKEAFTDEKTFNNLYTRWKRTRIIMSILGFIILQFSWIVPAIVIIFLGIYTYIKRRDVQDIDIRKLEKYYGKNYWKNDQ